MCSTILVPVAHSTPQPITASEFKPHLQVLQLVLLHVQDDLGAAPQLLALGVVGDGEGAARLLRVGKRLKSTRVEPERKWFVWGGGSKISWLTVKEPPAAGPQQPTTHATSAIIEFQPSIAVSARPAAHLGLPDVLLVVVVLGHHSHLKASGEGKP